MLPPRTSHLAAAAFAASLGVAAMPGAASAAPYAFASNQITGLSVTFLNSTGAPPSISATSTSLNATATFDGAAVASPSVSRPVGQANDLTMATVGTGNFGPENNFNQQGPGTFNGSRADASIGAGTAATGVAVNNVAEASSDTASGGAQAGNTANIQFTIQGTNQAVRIFGTSLVQLIANAAFGETATAAAANSISIRCATTACTNPAGPIDYAPGEINTTIGSGTYGSGNFGFDFTTPILAEGQLYVLTLSSQAIVNITQATQVPEPATLALLGAGLLGLAAVRRRR